MAKTAVWRTGKVGKQALPNLTRHLWRCRGVRGSEFQQLRPLRQWLSYGIEFRRARNAAGQVFENLYGGAVHEACFGYRKRGHDETRRRSRKSDPYHDETDSTAWFQGAFPARGHRFYSSMPVGPVGDSVPSLASYASASG